MPEKRRKYDTDFRDGAIRVVRETGKSIRQVAEDLGVNPGTLANWVMKDKIARGERLDPKKADPERVRQLELLEREKRAAERRLKAARFPTMKTLENFDFTARPSVNKLLVSELARCEFIDKRENVLLVGNPGTGKSHLATALAAAACQKGYKVRFFRATELVTTLIEARDERSFLRFKTSLAKLDLLVLDELGYVPASKVGTEL